MVPALTAGHIMQVGKLLAGQRFPAMSFHTHGNQQPDLRV
jgi:hypothetical protein